MAMGYTTERRSMYWAETVVAMFVVVVSGVTCDSLVTGNTQHMTTSSTSVTGVTVNMTSTTERDDTVSNTTPRSPRTPCVLKALYPFQEEIIHDLLKVQMFNLIEYQLVFPNNTINPLTHNMKYVFKGDTWARVSNVHGQTLLSLAFNYGILSLKTLTFGTDKLKVSVIDQPLGCMMQLNETQKVVVVRQLLMRDFKAEHTINITRSQVTLGGEDRVCYQLVTDVFEDSYGRVSRDGYGRFVDRCCFRDRITHKEECKTQSQNGWLMFLYVLLNAIRFGILAFGPLLFLSMIAGLVREEFPYIVKLQDPLIRNIVIYRKDAGGNQLAQHELKGRRRLDLRNQSGFAKLREITMNERAPVGTPFRAKFSQYDILVSYKRLLTENKVPVGFWRNLLRNVFFCKLRHIEPFQRCCRADMLRQPICRRVLSRLCPLRKLRSKLPWIMLWKKIGLALLIILLPTPYYFRLFIYYKFEETEVLARKDALQKLGLTEVFENSLIHYLLPTHPLFISIYAIYFIIAINLAFVVRHGDNGRFRKIIVGSFTDLKNLSWMNVLRMMIGNVIWPFQRFGLAGCLVAFVYWPIALPLMVIIGLFYYLPTIFLSIRMFLYSKRAFLRRVTKRPVKKSYRVRRTVDNSMRYFDASYLLGDDDDDDDSYDKNDPRPAKSSSFPLQHQSSITDTRRIGSVRSTAEFKQNHESAIHSEDFDDVTNIKREQMQGERRSVSIASTVFTGVGRGQKKVRRFLEHCGASILCVGGLYSIVILMSECVGFFVEMLVFTLMGVIVNAGSLLKFVALAVMLVAYSYDCFNNVEKKYLKLNKALFSEVKGRVKDLEKVTSLPSFLQENRGFKSQELSEQADYETSDDVSGDKPARHWLINDLVLFIDNEDMPRIPRKLFEDVCRIRVAGVPGPIYRGHLAAMKHFFKIVVFIFFVFIVILSFGSVYKVSSTNQMIAALAGGSLPFILRTVMQPEKPEIEIGTVSFKNQMDEIIKNFVQYWPIYDLPFDVYTAEDEEKDRQKKEQEEQSAAATDRGRRDTCDSSSLPSPLHETTAFPFDSGLMDMVDGNHVLPTVSEVSSSDMSYHVCFDVDDKDKEAEVDIVIYLPNKQDDTWLDEWSDLDMLDQRSSIAESLDNKEILPMTQLA